MKFLKWFLIVIAVLALLVAFVGMPYMKSQTKKNSPPKTATYSENGMDMVVNYSSPSKKDRVIFGGLVPYDVVWRTGANEATTFTSASDIMVIDKTLPAGTYSLWTKPKKESWTVIFNKEIPDWGVTILSGGKETTRNAEQDVLKVEVPVDNMSQPAEFFSIAFEEKEQLHLSIFWDKTKVNIPINK